MNAIPYIYRESQITFLHAGKPYTLFKDSPFYQKVMDALSTSSWEKVLKYLDLETCLKDFFGSIPSRDKNLAGPLLNGECDRKFLIEKLYSAIEKELPIMPLVNFIKKLSENPSKRSADQLYNFLEYKSLPITPEGNVIAFKGVGNDYYSVHGNTKTKVLKGKVDGSGRIYNAEGQEIEVDRLHVDPDPSKHCSHGLHVGSYNYAKSWGSKTMVVEFNPKDAVSVPNDCECQKLRLSKYKVLSEIVSGDDEQFGRDIYDYGSNEGESEEDGESLESTTFSTSKPNVSTHVSTGRSSDTSLKSRIESENAFVRAVFNRVRLSKKHGKKRYELRSLVNALSPLYLNMTRAEEILVKMGYKVVKTGSSKAVML